MDPKLVLEITSVASSLAASVAARFVIAAASRLKAGGKTLFTPIHPEEMTSAVPEPSGGLGDLELQTGAFGSTLPKAPPVSPIRTHLQARFSEARAALDTQQRRARLYSWASTLLIFGQYIVGAALASSFVQETVSRTVVGSLGLVVLLASAIQQRFRPDAATRSAKRRILQMRRALRTAEDDVVALNSGDAGAPSAREILEVLSKGISDLELAELDDADLGDPDRQPKTTPVVKEAKSGKAAAARKPVQ